METFKKLSLSQFLGLLSILCFLLHTNSSFGQVVKASAKQLTQESTAILTGKCTKTESFWNEKRTQILTEVRIRVDEYVKGNLGAEAVITIPGGRVGNIIYEVSDMPVFVEGEEVLVFLWRHPSGKNLVTGALQGKISLVEDKGSGKKIVYAIPPEREQKTSLRKRRIEKTPATKRVFLEDFIIELKSYVKE